MKRIVILAAILLFILAADAGAVWEFKSIKECNEGCKMDMLDSDSGVIVSDVVISKAQCKRLQEYFGMSLKEIPSNQLWYCSNCGDQEKIVHEIKEKIMHKTKEKIAKESR